MPSADLLLFFQDELRVKRHRRSGKRPGESESRRINVVERTVMMASLAAKSYRGSARANPSLARESEKSESRKSRMTKTLHQNSDERKR